jgi:aminopeptidase N
MYSRWRVLVPVVGLLLVAPIDSGQAAVKTQSAKAESVKAQGDDRRPQPGVQGSSGLGDRFFPLAGNGGYDVANYDLNLSWDPATGILKGEAKIEAKTLQNLSRFNLDFRGFTITRLTVNEKPAAYVRDGQELVVTPRKPIEAREDLEISVRYEGKPETVIDPDGALDGWIPTDDGVIALSEPQGSPSWFPVNDYPTDKATLTLAMTVPNGLSVIGNGLPESPDRRGPNTTYIWRERRPMASYLAMVAIGKFDVTRSSTSTGIPIINAVDPRLAAASASSIARIGEILDWETSLLGTYPYESIGAIVDEAPNVGYALETQTRPVFTFAADDSTMVHELSHQWLGNSVSLSTWPDIWLNEGWATYFEWLWSAREGGPTPQQIANDTYNSYAANDPFWTIAPAALPDATQLFTEPAYLRGSMTLQALRTEIGDDAFFRLVRQWASRRDSNASTADFITLAQSVSGRNLTALFQTWLFTPAKPATSPAPGAIATTNPGARTAPVKAHLDARAKPVQPR